MINDSYNSSDWASQVGLVIIKSIMSLSESNLVLHIIKVDINFFLISNLR